MFSLMIILFIYVRQEVVEDIRERMRVETGLVVVGSADDQLRVGKTKKLMEGVTQSMIDRCILVSIKKTKKLFCHVVKICCPLLELRCIMFISMFYFSLLVNKLEHCFIGSGFSAIVLKYTISVK
jgi:hypothetical protein